MSSPPVLADMTNYHIRIKDNIINQAYMENQGINVENLTISEEAIQYITHYVRESYKASSGKALTGDSTVDAIAEEIINITSLDILTSIAQSITSDKLQELGNVLISNHSRNTSYPFHQGDIYTFSLNILPNNFVVFNDSPNNVAHGTTFFNTTIDGKSILVSPQENVTISQWIYTIDAQLGPYYEGTAEDGFLIDMAFLVYEDDTYNYVYDVIWAIQPTELNATYQQSWSTTTVDNSFNTYVAFYSRSSSSTNSSDLVVAKFDQSGNILWHTLNNVEFQTSANSTFREESPNIIVSEDTNQIIVAYMSTNTTGTGGGDSRIISLDKDTASVNWTYSGSEINSPYNDGTPKIALSISDNTIVLTASVRGNTSESDGAYQGASIDHDDIIFAKFNLTTGSHIWTKHHSVMNTSSTEVYPSVATDSDGNIYIVYMSLGSVNSLTNEGSFDIFFLKANIDGDIISITNLVGLNTNSTDIVPTLRYSSYDDTLYICHSRHSPFEIVITKISTDGNVIWSKGDSSVNIDVVNEYIGMDIDQTNGMCVFAYSASETRPGNHDITVGAVDPSGDVRYIEKPSILQSSNAEYSPSVVVDSGGNVRIAYETEGSVNGGVYQGSRDIVITSLSKDYS
jgi:hypothetical protein